MKWTRETQSYMWAQYHSEDGKWVAWDEDVQTTSSRKSYNPLTKQWESKTILKHVWNLKNKITGETVTGFKTLTEAKKFAEQN